MASGVSLNAPWGYGGCGRGRVPVDEVVAVVVPITHERVANHIEVSVCLGWPAFAESAELVGACCSFGGGAGENVGGVGASYSQALCAAVEGVVASPVASPVEVFVTDRAEWRRRTEEVSASFEASIASSVVVLVDRPVGAVRWDKEIGLADNNTDEALSRLDEATKALTTIMRSMRPDDWEFGESEHDYGTRWRLVDVYSAGAMATETALKALAAARGTPAPHKHRIDLLVPLAGRRTDDARAALADLEDNTVARGDAPYGDLSIWRAAGTYIADRPDIDVDAVAAMAPSIARAAISVTAIAADELDSLAPAAAEVTRARRIVELADGTLATSGPSWLSPVTCGWPRSTAASVG